MKKLVLLLITACVVQLCIAQSPTNERKLRSPIWTYHSNNTDVIGLSVGLVPESVKEVSGTSRTFGIRLEADPISVLYFMFYNRYDIAEDLEEFGQIMSAPVAQKSYGLNISSGNIANIDTYGISVTALIQKTRLNNGISFAGGGNIVEKSNGIIMGLGNMSFVSNGISLSLISNSSKVSNGIQITGISNDSNVLKGIQIGGSNSISSHGLGLQIGIFNKATNFRGIQLGLWNKNDKRSLPILNWNFKN